MQVNRLNNPHMPKDNNKIKIFGQNDFIPLLYVRHKLKHILNIHHPLDIHNLIIGQISTINHMTDMDLFFILP